jgi:tetratricopeptide (TPR) repeat protein
MERTFRKVLTISLFMGLMSQLSCHAEPTSAEAAELAKVKTMLENHESTPSMRTSAIEQLSSLINKNPNLGEAYCYRAEIYQQLRNATESLKNFNKAIELNPKLGRAYIGRGILMYGRRDFAAAVNDFDKAIEDGERTFTAYHNRGSAYQQLDQHEKAIQDLTTSIDIKPLWTAHLMRAMSYIATNKTELAIKDFDAALATKNFPTDIAADVHEKRGIALGITKKYKEAIEDFNAAAAVFTGEKKGRAIYLRSKARYQLGDQAAAEADRKLAQSLGFPKEGPQDKTLHADSTDKIHRLEEAIKPLIEEARKTLPTAKAKYLKGLPSGDSFSITTKLRDDAGKFEQVFVFVDKWDGTTISGTLGNDVSLRGFKKGDKLKVEEKDVLDWTISKPDGTEEGNVIGKFLDTWKG